MSKHEILKTFDGSQDGRFTEQFVAGTTVELSDYLADMVVPVGWASPVGKVVEVENKAIITDAPRRGRPLKIKE